MDTRAQSASTTNLWRHKSAHSRRHHTARPTGPHRRTSAYASSRWGPLSLPRLCLVSLSAESGNPLLLSELPPRTILSMVRTRCTACHNSACNSAYASSRWGPLRLPRLCLVSVSAGSGNPLLLSPRTILSMVTTPTSGWPTITPQRGRPTCTTAPQRRSPTPIRLSRLLVGGMTMTMTSGSRPMCSKWRSGTTPLVMVIMYTMSRYILPL